LADAVHLRVVARDGNFNDDQELLEDVSRIVQDRLSTTLIVKTSTQERSADIAPGYFIDEPGVLDKISSLTDKFTTSDIIIIFIAQSVLDVLVGSIKDQAKEALGTLVGNTVKRLWRRGKKEEEAEVRMEVKSKGTIVIAHRITPENFDRTMSAIRETLVLS
jgi:hypothetical protein